MRSKGSSKLLSWPSEQPSAAHYVQSNRGRMDSPGSTNSISPFQTARWTEITWCRVPMAGKLQRPDRC